MQSPQLALARHPRFGDLEKAGHGGFTACVQLCDLPSRNGLAYLLSRYQIPKQTKAKEGRRRAFR
jgi:hypothetical protein